MPSRESSPAPREVSTPAPEPSRPPRETATPRSSGERRGKAKEVAPDNSSDKSDVADGSRTRGDRPVIGKAVPRTGPRPPRDSDERNDSHECRGCLSPGIAYVPYYDPFAYYGCGYGLGYDFYPGAYGYPLYPMYGFGYGMSYGYAPCGGGLDEGTGAPSSPPSGGPTQGSLKLKVKPRNAKVYVDGFYVGTVDDFDGASQKLTLNEGRHQVELRAEGFETTVLEVDVTADRTVTFAGKMIELKRIQ